MQEPEHILINAATVKIAGGLIVTNDLINLLSEKTDYRVTVICPFIRKFQKLPDSIARIYTPEWLLKPFLRWLLDFFWLPRAIKKLNPNLVVSMGNLPARATNRQIMFHDNAFISQKNLSDIPLPFIEKLKHFIRKTLFWHRLKFVDLLVVQTYNESNRFKSFNKKLPEIKVLMPLLPSHLIHKSLNSFYLSEKTNNTVRLACISYYWPHKNIKILNDVLNLTSNTNFPLQIVFTLNEKKVKGGKKLVTKMKPHILAGRAINLGNLSPSKVKAVINECDGLILPSLLETFGLNSLEAWYCKKVFLVADKAYAREICNDSAVYFNPLDAHDILSKIQMTFQDKAYINQLTLSGTKKIAEWNFEADYISLFKEYM